MNDKRQTTHNELTDTVVEGFQKLDDNLLDKKPPKIKWLPEFEKKDLKVQLEYVKKLASTMNNAAKLVSDERDKLVELMILKEKQLEMMSKQLQDNNVLIQNQINKMNEQRQGFIIEMQKLKAKMGEAR